jgi:hypothetical protein
MKRTGQYCKAYQVGRLRQFAGWTENTQNLKPATGENGTDGEPNRILGDDDFLYLQENYVATESIFVDEHVVFDNVTPEWQEFCRRELSFDPAPAVS